MEKTLAQLCNESELDILVQWLRMAKRKVVIEDGIIVEVIQDE